MSNITPQEGRRIVTALGGQAAVARAFGVSPRTVRRFVENGAGGANAAALRLAYWVQSLGVGVDWRTVIRCGLDDYVADLEGRVCAGAGVLAQLKHARTG